MDLISIILAVACLLVGIVVGIVYRKKIAEGKVGVAEERARKIVDDAAKEAEARKKEILLEAKEDSIRTKNELEREVRERRNELQKNERRLFQKEETLDKKVEALEKKEEHMTKKLEELDRQKEEAKALRERQLQELERISGLTTEEAKNHILAMVENMSYLQCPHCDEKIEIYGKSKIDSIASEYGVKTVAKLPINPEITNSVDAGEIETVDVSALAPVVEMLSSL